MKKEKEIQQFLENYLLAAKQSPHLEFVLTPAKLYGESAFQPFHENFLKNGIKEEYKEFVPKIINTITASLKDMDLLYACSAAYFCGILIERSGIHQAGKPIVDLFAKVIVLACEYLAEVSNFLKIDAENLDVSDIEKVEKEALFELNPNRMKAYYGCELLTLVLMTIISRDAQTRFYLREKNVYNQIQYAQSFIKNVCYVEEVYSNCSDLEIFVLVPEAEKGFVIKVDDVGNCFHLFTLLEAELCKKGWLDRYYIKNYKWDEEIYQIAIGKAWPEREYSICAHQQYYTFEAIQKDGSICITKNNQVDVNTLVWGEMPPESILKLENKTVIIMKNEGMFGNRSWDAEFIRSPHSALNPKLEIIKELSEGEYKEWMTKVLETSL